MSFLKWIEDCFQMTKRRQEKENENNHKKNEKFISFFMLKKIFERKICKFLCIVLNLIYFLLFFLKFILNTSSYSQKKKLIKVFCVSFCAYPTNHDTSKMNLTFKLMSTAARNMLHNLKNGKKVHKTQKTFFLFLKKRSFFLYKVNQTDINGIKTQKFLWELSQKGLIMDEVKNREENFIILHAKKNSKFAFLLMKRFFNFPKKKKRRKIILEIFFMCSWILNGFIIFFPSLK